MTADFATACGPYVMFNGNVTNCQSGAPSTVGNDFFSDVSAGSITVVKVDTNLTPNITYTFHLTLS